MRGVAAAVLVPCFYFLHSCSGLRSRLKTQLLTNTDADLAEYPSGHQVLWQEQVNARFTPDESIEPVEAVVVLTTEHVNAFVIPNTPSCKPCSFGALEFMVQGTGSEDFKFMYRRDPYSFLDVVTYVGSWDRDPDNSDGEKIVRIKYEYGGKEDVEFEYGNFYLMQDPRTERLPTHESSSCAYPEPAASIAVSTITVNVDSMIMRQNDPKGVLVTGRCQIIAGCSDDPCRERLVWHVFSGNFGSGDGLHRATLDAHLKINALKELLGPAISTAVKNRELNFADLGGGLNLDDVAHAFEQGVIPKSGGKNSKSGAAFFYSSDKAYIAKRIRAVEYSDAVVNMMAGDKYRHHVNKGSVLCPTYLAFQSAGDTWIVMKTEQLTPRMRALVPKMSTLVTHDFFADIKPHPMTSDRISMLSQMKNELLHRKFSLKRLHGWARMLRIFSDDLAFLEQHQIVDYSIWVYGTLFDLPNKGEVQKWRHEFAPALAEANRPGCMFGCQPSFNQPLADLTNAMNSEKNRVRKKGKIYKCCCVVLSPESVDKVLSPCVLKSLDATPVRSGLNKTGCGSLVGKNWHSYWRMSSYDLTLKNRCLVALGVAGGAGRDIPGDSMGFPALETWPSDVISPESLGISYTPESPAWRCGVVCVSIGDYFLKFGAWEKFENAALILWYRALKWTKYRSKIMSLMEEVSEPTLGGNVSVGEILRERVVTVVPKSSRRAVSV